LNDIWLILLVAAGAAAGIYAALLAALVLTGRRAGARAFARFVPDCAVLAKRLLGDPRMPRRHKLLLGATLVYLASPIDLVPDFVPVVGQLDDALLVWIVLRRALGSCSPSVLAEHWPGPPTSLDVVLRLTRSRPAT
jgi:uncharacterized membrane protein YkvA (DUF1232 family)